MDSHTKCKNECCSEVVSSNQPDAEYCAKCYLYMWKTLPIFHRPLHEMPFKRTQELIPNQCKMKRCKNQVWLKGMCKKCFIEYRSPVSKIMKD
jgi:hypothetical protein